jgi:hypothetical protein
MNAKSGRIARLIFGLGLSLCAAGLSLALTSCVGYVQGDGGVVAAPEPDFFWFGGYDGGYSGDYGRRGEESRRASGRSGSAPAAHAAAPAHSGGAAAPAGGRSGGGRR